MFRTRLESAKTTVYKAVAVDRKFEQTCGLGKIWERTQDPFVPGKIVQSQISQHSDAFAHSEFLGDFNPGANR